MLDVKVRTTPDLDRVADQFKRAGNPLVIRAEIRNGVKGLARPARAAVAAAARSLPARRNKHTGLRSLIARAAQARTVNEPSGVALVVGIRRELMGERRSLPGHIEAGSWRHPVYGNTNVWVTQTSRANWFSDAINHSVVPMMEEAMEKTADSVASSFVK